MQEKDNTAIEGSFNSDSKRLDVYSGILYRVSPDPAVMRLLPATG